MVKLKVNGKEHAVEVSPDTPLLWVLQETLGLTGTKFGCGTAQCGACTVHLDGEAARSCVTPLSRRGQGGRHHRGALARRKRSRGEGDNCPVGARDRDGHWAAIEAVGNTGRCPCSNRDYAGPGGRLSARVSPLGMATPDETTGCVGVSVLSARLSSA
jgi:hypothetical protein